MAQFPLLPLLTPLSSPSVSPSTYLAPSRCDRNCPSSSQVACKLTPFVPSTQLTHPPFPAPQTPVALRLTTTTSGIYWLLISSTERNEVRTCDVFYMQMAYARGLQF